MNYRELRETLIGKGQAVLDDQRDHVFFYLEVEGKLHRASKLSHAASGQINPSLLSTIAHQMRLRPAELNRFENCALNREQWIELWKQRADWGLSGPKPGSGRQRRR